MGYISSFCKSSIKREATLSFVSSVERCSEIENFGFSKKVHICPKCFSITKNVCIFISKGVLPINKLTPWSKSPSHDLPNYRCLYNSHKIITCQLNYFGLFTCAWRLINLLKWFRIHMFWGDAVWDEISTSHRTSWYKKSTGPTGILLASDQRTSINFDPCLWIR